MSNKDKKQAEYLNKFTLADPERKPEPGLYTHGKGKSVLHVFEDGTGWYVSPKGVNKRMSRGRVNNKFYDQEYNTPYKPDFWFNQGPTDVEGTLKVIDGLKDSVENFNPAPGIYRKLNGKSYLIVNPDHTGRYISNKGQDTLVGPKRVRSLFNSGFVVRVPLTEENKVLEGIHTRFKARNLSPSDVVDNPVTEGITVDGRPFKVISISDAVKSAYDIESAITAGKEDTLTKVVKTVQLSETPKIDWIESWKDARNINLMEESDSSKVYVLKEQNESLKLESRKWEKRAKALSDDLAKSEAAHLEKNDVQFSQDEEIKDLLQLVEYWKGEFEHAARQLPQYQTSQPETTLMASEVTTNEEGDIFINGTRLPVYVLEDVAIIDREGGKNLNINIPLTDDAVVSARFIK